MQQEKSLLDREFGLSQLSGNQDLLVKLLSKFKAEYADAHLSFCELISDNKTVDAKNMIHTIKGVAGNLGMNALHFFCKELEQSIVADSVEKSMQDDFASVLDNTFSEIDDFSSQGSSAETPAASSSNAKAELISALQSNEYIPADKLDAMLASTDLSEEQRTSVSESINDLDYAAALGQLEA